MNRNLPVPLSVDPRTDPAQDRIKSLFDARHQIVGTDFVGRWDAKVSRHFVKLLQAALIRAEVLPGVTGIELRGRGGITQPTALVESQRFKVRVGKKSLVLPAIALSQGYQSMIAWLADFIGQAMIAAGDGAERLTLDTIAGLVLVDEIDLHLHPRWQRTLVGSLKRAFPNVQFVATTHSPLVLAGLEADEIWILEQDAEGSVTARPSDAVPSLMTASSVLQTFFGVASVAPDDTAGKLRRLAALDALGNDRTKSEQTEWAKLRGELR